MWRLKPRESSQKGREEKMRRIRKNIHFCIKVPYRGDPSREILIQFKPVWMDRSNVKVSVWDFDYEIGTFVCPRDWYKIHEDFFKLIDQVLENYPDSHEYNLVQKRKAEFWSKIPLIYRYNKR